MWVSVLTDCDGLLEAERTGGALVDMLAGCSLSPLCTAVSSLGTCGHSGLEDCAAVSCALWDVEQ